MPLGSGLTVAAGDEIGITRGGDEGYATLGSLATAVIAQIASLPTADRATLAAALISTDANNTIVAAAGDGLLFENDSI